MFLNANLKAMDTKVEVLKYLSDICYSGLPETREALSSLLFGFDLEYKFIVTLSLIRRTACALAQFSGCSSTTNALSEMGQMAVCCQNLKLGALSSRSALSVPVGALIKRFSFFLNTPRMLLGRCKKPRTD